MIYDGALIGQNGPLESVYSLVVLKVCQCLLGLKCGKESYSSGGSFLLSMAGHLITYLGE